MNNFFIKILFVLLISILIYIGYYAYINSTKNKVCKIDDFDIDDIVVTKRTPEYSNLINDLINDKSFIFTDDELKVLKNPQQIFKLSDQNNLSNLSKLTQANLTPDIKNISDMIYIDCKNQLDSQLSNEYFSSNIFDDDIIDVSDKQYEKIKKKLKDDISIMKPIDCNTVGVLDPNIPFNRNYLDGYYLDIYGNKIDAKLSDYIGAYRTLINQDNNIGLPVNTLIGHSNFIIPDQYNYDKHFTNAYNIDWDRIINPLGYSM